MLVADRMAQNSWSNNDALHELRPWSQTVFELRSRPWSSSL